MRKPVMTAAVLLAAWVSVARAQCGGDERWAVKVGADPDAAQINLAPQTMTLHDLVSLPRPTLPSDDITRTAQEGRVVTIDGRLVQFRQETGKTGDSDFHLVISDDTQLFSAGGAGAASPHSVIAEIPDPDCVAGRNNTVAGPSHFATQLNAVRSRFLQQFSTITSGWNHEDGVPVRVTGVLFYDRPHGQVGRALNGVELHPVLDIVFNPPPVGPPPAPAPAILANPGFESGDAGWTASAEVIRADGQEQPHTGNGFAWLGGYGKAHTDRLSQDLALPAGATAISVSFFLHVTTEENTSGILDRLRVRVRTTSGSLLATLKVLSNLDATDGFTKQTFDLTPYRGRTVRLSLEATEDAARLTSWVVDDFELVVEP